LGAAGRLVGSRLGAAFVLLLVAIDWSSSWCSGWVGWLCDCAWAVGDGQDLILGCGVGLVVIDQSGGVWAVSGEAGDCLSSPDWLRIVWIVSKTSSQLSRASSLVGAGLDAALVCSSLARLLRGVGGGGGGSRVVGIWVVAQAGRELCGAEGLVSLWCSAALIGLSLTINSLSQGGGISQGRSQDNKGGDAVTHGEFLGGWGRVACMKDEWK